MRGRLTVLMIKINFNLLQILTMNSLNVKHQGKSSNQLAFHMSAYTHLWNLKSNISEVYKIQVDCLKDSELDIYDKSDIKEKINDLVRLQRQCKKNWKQHHIQNKAKLWPCYLIHGLKCTVENILMSLNTLFKLHMKSKK